MNSASPSPNYIASTIPSNSKAPEGGVGGFSGGPSQGLRMRRGAGRSKGPCLACPWRWALSTTERRVNGEAVRGEARKKPASEHSDWHTCECGQISDLVRAMAGGGWMQRLQCSLKLALDREEHSSWRRPAYWV